MDEYIEREAVMDVFMRYGIGWGNAKVKGVINSIPAADVREVKRGKWTKELHPNVHYNQYKCSICGEFSGHDSCGWIWEPNFCPNCGADMRIFSTNCKNTVTTGEDREISNLRAMSKCVKREE